MPSLATLTLVLTSLVWITQTLRMIHLIDKGIEFSYFLKLVLFIIPSLLFMILPIITVLSVVHVYNRLQDERQIVILRSSGLSNFDLAKPALMVATIVTIIAYLISAYLMPLSYNKLKEGLTNFREGYVSNIIEARTFNQISKNSTIYVDNKNSDGSLEGIVLFDNKLPKNRTILFAKNGRIIISDQYKTSFELTSGLRHSYDQLGNLTKLYFDHLVVAINGESSDSTYRQRTSLELYIQEMIWPDKKLSQEKQNRLITDGHLRIVWPLFNFAFVFLALSVFLNQPYNRKSHIKQFILTFLPILLSSYIHFTVQKIAYKDLNYIFLCYLNVILCIIFSIWQSTKKTL